MAPNSSAVKENDRSDHRWVWLLLLLAMLMSFSCVFCSTWWAFWWPDRLTPASLLAHRRADYRHNAADDLNFGLLDPLVVAQAATDIARLQMTPAGDGVSIPDVIIGLLPATATPTDQPEAQPLPQATSTPGSDTTLPTPLPSPPTDTPPATATASPLPPTATLPLDTPTLVATSTSLPTSTPVSPTPTLLPTSTATLLPPTLPPPPPTSPPNPNPNPPPVTNTPVPPPPTNTATPTATPTATATPTNTPIPAGTVLALCGTGITIDGMLSEPAWSGPATSASKVVLGSPALIAVTYKVIWDTTSVYVGVDVVDTTPISDSIPTYWEDDAVEIFFDIDSSDDPVITYSADDFQFAMEGGDPSNYFLKNPASNYFPNGTGGVQFSFNPTAAGYSMEIVIPWSLLGTTPSPGNVYGFDLGADDDQDGGTRETQLMWYGIADNWQDTSAFGNLLLANCVP